MLKEIQHTVLHPRKTGVYTSPEGRIAIVFALVMSLLTASLIFYTQDARAAQYSCYNPHCYGGWDWNGPTNPSYLNGSETQIYITTLMCPTNTCDGSIDNEMWLVDYACNYGRATCWVEAGYSTYLPNDLNDCILNSNVRCYFWAEERPDGTYAEHTPNGVRINSYDHYTKFSIVRSADYDSLWNVTITPLAGTDGPFSGQSHNNTIYPHDIQIGQELFGTGGASAPDAYFIGNRQLIKNSSWAYQHNRNGSPLNNPGPTTSYWYVYPDQDSTGGLFVTCTLSAC